MKKVENKQISFEELRIGDVFRYGHYDFQYLRVYLGRHREYSHVHFFFSIGLNRVLTLEVYNRNFVVDLVLSHSEIKK